MVSKSVMINRIAIVTILTAGVSLPHSTNWNASAAVAQSLQQHQQQPPEFQRVEQPLVNKIAVTIGGLSLIGLELWWFLGSKPQSHNAASQGGIQSITITVNGGYEPSYIVVRAGQPVRLNFDRQDPSSCLEEIRLPDFRIAKSLPLNQITAIEFTPDQPGKYQFTCGMNMFRGVIDVQSAA
jgi:plastocyanin domain-containing protein